MKSALVIISTAGTLLASSNSVHAITFTTGGTTVTNQGLYTSVSRSTTANFELAPNKTSPFSTTYTSGPATFTSTDGLLIRNSAQTSKNYAPANDTSHFLITGGYYDQGNAGYTPTGNTSGISTYRDPVTISFGNTGLNYFGLYWGLINETNQIQFYSTTDASGTALTITGTGTAGDTAVTGNELAISGVSPGASGPSGFVNFYTASGETIKSVKLTNNGSTSQAPGNGFEVDNVAYRAVPWAPSPILSILGLGAWGAIIGIKRQLRNKVKL